MQLTPNSNLPTDKLYDLSLIDKMCRGNKDKVVKMVNIFIHEISQSTQEINTAYSKEDYLKLKKIIHKVKPTLTYFGIEKLQKELHQIEILLSNGFEKSKLEPLIINFTNLTIKVIEKMKNDF